MISMLLAISLGIILFFGLCFYILIKKIAALEHNRQNDQLMAMLNTNMQGVQQRIDQTTQSLNQRLDRAAMVIADVKEKLGGIQEIGRDIKSFQDFFSSPKLRGNIGEHILNDTLSQVFSKDHFELQYKFREGQVVDAIIKTDKGIIPIDSKFPMDNYKKMRMAENDAERQQQTREFVRAVKKHLDDVGDKYILPHEGTIDFAVMYVPSESVYYEIITDNNDLMEYAQNKKVLLVSPNGFFHFLKVILMGFERTKLQQEAQRVWELLSGIQQEAGKFGEALGLVSRHVTNAKNAVDSAQSEYMKLAGKIDQVKLLK